MHINFLVIAAFSLPRPTNELGYLGNRIVSVINSSLLRTSFTM